MRVTVLAEDTAGCDGVTAEHGLSLLVNASGRTVLCDAGQSDATWHNAATLGAPLDDVCEAVLSHGHYDHSGGFAAFLTAHPDVPLYMRCGADGDFFHGERYIGIDKALATLPQTKQIDDAGITRVDDVLSLFGGFGATFSRPEGNAVLTVRDEAGERPDTFSHEQAAVITEGDKRVLISGCAHSGILNVLERFSALYGGMPTAVFSGFHTAKPTPYTADEAAAVRALGRALAATGVTFYTGHCTGTDAFALLKEEMGERLCSLTCGKTIYL